MYTLYKFHFLNGISEINQLFDDILIIWPAPVIMNVASQISLLLFFFRSSKINLASHYWKMFTAKIYMNEMGVQQPDQSYWGTRAWYLWFNIQVVT